MKTLTFGSLFAGIGGIDLGLERAGMQCKWQVEIDDYATRVLARHWPDVQRFRDVVKFSSVAGQYPVDMVAGGFPCQPVSVAGARRGDSDERWLWDSFRDVIGAIRPKYVLAENVPGLLSADAGRLFGNVVGDLASLGFDVEWGCVPAAAFDLPHLRWRVFIVAYSNCGRFKKCCQQYCAKEPEQFASQRNNIDGFCEAAPNSAGSRHAVARNVKEDSKSKNCDEQRINGFDKPSNYVCNTNCKRLEGQRRLWESKSYAHVEKEKISSASKVQWSSIKPTVCRGSNGVPDRVDRIRCLGNAVVPQVAEWVGRMIVKFDERIQ